MIEMTNKKDYLSEVKIKGLIVKYQKHIRNAASTHGRRVKKALIKTITTGSRSGRVYKYRGRSYTASAPGEPPANRSGRLAETFGYTVSADDLTIWNDAKSKKGKPYPLYLEEGTVKIEPRPYFVNTILKFNNDFARDLERFNFD